MLKEGKVYVPKDKALRVEIIRLHHDMLWGFTDKGLYYNTDLCRDHKFRRRLCTKEFKGEVNQEMGRVIKKGIELRSFIS